MQTELNLDFAHARPVVTRGWTEVEIILVGCGGTGSWLAPSLARLARAMQESGRNVKLCYIDPDTVEAVNVPRQNFCEAEIGANKARALALRYEGAWGVPIGCVAGRLDPKSIPLPDGETLQVLVGCVDNAQARRSIAEVLNLHNGRALALGQPPGTWWLDCGNGLESGQVLLGCASVAAELRGAFTPDTICRALPSPAMQRPELLEPLPEERTANNLSCVEIALRNAQSLMVNQNVAAIAADYLLRLVMTGGLRKFATYIDLPSGACKSLHTTPEAVSASINEPLDIFESKEKVEERVA
jgi:PRTRC genetic system ThiF family protein